MLIPKTKKPNREPELRIPSLLLASSLRRTNQMYASFLDFVAPRSTRSCSLLGNNIAFTLLEAVIALAVLSIGLIAIINSESISLKLFDFSLNNTRGAILARYRMTYYDFLLTNKTFSEVPEDEKGDFKDIGYSEFTWEMEFKKDEDIAKLGKLATSLKGKEGEGEDSAASLAASFVGISPELITKTLEDNIKKLTLTVSWEDGFDNGSITLWRHYMSKELQGMAGLGGPPAPAQEEGTTQPPQNPPPPTSPPPSSPPPGNPPPSEGGQ